MTARELIKELMEARDLDVEVGIAFDDGWTYIKNVDIPRSGYGDTIKLQPEDTLYDRQIIEGDEE